MPSLESARNPRENIYSRSGQYGGFETTFFPINLSPDFGYESTRRGRQHHCLLLAVFLTLIGSESVSSKYQNILGMLQIEVRDKKQRKRREKHNSSKPPHVYVLTRGCMEERLKHFIVLYKSVLEQCLRKNLALSYRFMCRARKNLVSADISESFGPTKKRFALVRMPLT